MLAQTSISCYSQNVGGALPTKSNWRWRVPLPVAALFVSWTPPLSLLLLDEKDDEELMYTFCYYGFDCALLLAWVEGPWPPGTTAD